MLRVLVIAGVSFCCGAAMAAALPNYVASDPVIDAMVECLSRESAHWEAGDYRDRTLADIKAHLLDCSYEHAQAFVRAVCVERGECF